MEAYKEECRDASGFAPLRPLHGFGGDLKLACRRLAAAPLFTLFAVLSIAIGVGVTTAVYSVVDSILWKEPGVGTPAEVVLVAAPQFGRYNVRAVISRPDFEDLRTRQTSFANLSASHPVFAALTTTSTTDLLPAEAVDGQYFATLDVRAAIGRTIQPSDHPSAPVVVIGDDLWRTIFGGDPRIVGRTVRLAGRLFEVVGVAPANFGGAIPGPIGSQLWVPLGTAGWFAGAEATGFENRARPVLTVIGRLKAGTTSAAASAELEVIADAVDATYPLPKSSEGQQRRRAWRADTITNLNEQGSGMRGFGQILVGLGALALVVACTNLANLVLARGTTRQQELAVRRALGASRWRLVRELCAESVVLTALGAVAAFVFLKSLTSALEVEIPMSKFWIASLEPEVNAAALAVAGTALLLSMLVFGLEPAFQLTRKADVNAPLGGGTGTVGLPKTKRQRALLRWQVAISAGFFLMSALSVRYLVAEARHDSGVDMDQIGVASLSFYAQGWDEARAQRAIARVLEEVEKVPELEAAAVASGLPFGTTGSPLVSVFTPDKRIAPNRSDGYASLIAATPALFKVIGVPITEGRAFDDRDDAGAPRVIILSQSAARKLFGTTDVVGRNVLVKNARGTTNPWTDATQMIIVGISRDTDVTHLFSRNGHLVYVPFAQAYQRWVVVVGRAGNAETAIRAVRNVIRQADPELGIQTSGTGYVMLAGPHVLLQTVGNGALALGVLTLFLAMIGLYGVQAQIVAHRTREIGVRMSLGASISQVRRLVLKDGFVPVLQGLALALFIGIAGRAIVQSMTPLPIGIVDRWMLLLVPVPLLLAAFFACWLPAHRASRVDPNVALRHL
jgi:predicted permease